MPEKKKRAVVSAEFGSQFALRGVLRSCFTKGRTVRRRKWWNSQTHRQGPSVGRSVPVMRQRCVACAASRNAGLAKHPSLHLLFLP